MPIYVRCANCQLIRPLPEARGHYCWCRHCYTYYCSRSCRQRDWERHRDKCSFARINSLCKEVIMKVFFGKIFLNSTNRPKLRKFWFKVPSPFKTTQEYSHLPLFSFKANLSQSQSFSILQKSFQYSPSLPNEIGIKLINPRILNFYWRNSWNLGYTGYLKYFVKVAPFPKLRLPLSQN